MSEQTTNVIGEDVKRLPLKDLMKRIGPGLIATGIVIGPGAVTTAAMLGSNYGYSLIWLVFPIIFMGMTFMMVTNRLAIVTGMPTIHAIRKYYGPVASGIVSVATFMACLFFTMGNISGTGAGMNLIFGLNWKVGSVIMIAVVLYCYFAKNVYSKVEKLITACILVMIVSFYATLVGVGGPDWGEFGKGLVGLNCRKEVWEPLWPLSPPTPPLLRGYTIPIWARRRSGRRKTCSMASCLRTLWCISSALF